jgi:hypothetical protein
LTRILPRVALVTIQVTSDEDVLQEIPSLVTELGRLAELLVQVVVVNEVVDTHSILLDAL